MVNVCWVNTWSMRELQVCGKELYSDVMDEDLTAERYIIFGGTVRDVLTKPNRTLRDLYNEFGASHAALLGSLDTEGIRSAVSHTLAHIRVRSQDGYWHLLALRHWLLLCVHADANNTQAL